MPKTTVFPKADGTTEVTIETSEGTDRQRKKQVKDTLRAFLGRAKVGRDRVITIYPEGDE